MEFEVSFRETLRQLADTEARLQSVGSLLDRLETNTRRSASASAQGIAKLNGEYLRLQALLDGTRKNTEGMSKALEVAHQTGQKSFRGMAQANARATTELQAMTGQLGTMDRLLKDTQSKKAYLNWLNRSAAAQANLAGEAQHLQTRLQLVNTEEGRRVLSLRDQIRQSERAARANRQTADSLTNYRMIVGQLERAERELAVTGERLAWGYQRMTTEAASLSASQNRAKTAIDQANRAMVEGEQNLHRFTGANARAARAAEDLARSQTQADSRRRAELNQLRQSIEQRAEADRRSIEVTRQYVDSTRRLSTSEARSREERQRQIRVAEAYNQAMLEGARAQREAGQEGHRYALVLRRIQNAMETRGGNTLNQQFAQLAQYGRSATASLRLLGDQQAVLQAQEERLSSTVSRHNQLRLQQARSANTLTQQEAALEQRYRSLNRLQELRNQLAREQQASTSRLTLAEAEQTRAIQRQIEAYRLRNTVAQKTTAQLVGMKSAHGRLSREMHLNAQAAAMFRAALGGLNASIGIYTSATVLAASATYATAAAIRNTISTGIEFTDTMARAEAVMMTGSGAISEYGRSMDGLSMQVRALGATTMYTANQAAEALTELGMAGLSANQAMMALEPTLNLAAIGNLEMGRSADIATNVMTAFNKQASDLSEVTDVLAYSITNSNTTLEQLANSLSYVGPAAQAAGFELEDTSAAIQTLANAGIKGSRAGTGLRRVMVNLQNPTTKGAAVLEQYSIRLDDAEGNTRTLTDILGQMNEAFSDLTPAERMSAIVDLFGVRASQSAARLVGAVDELSAFRREMEIAEGTAQSMRDTIEDTLGTDFRRLVSAFNDIQLDIFDQAEASLRKLTSQLTLFLAKQQEVNVALSLADGYSMEEIESGTGVTELSILIGKLEQLGRTVLWLGGTFAAFKGASIMGTMFGALSTTLDRRTLPHLQELGRRMEHQRVQTDLLNVSTNRLTVSQAASARGMTAVYGAASAATGAVTAFGVAVQRISWFLGTWGAVIGGAATILYSLYNASKHAFADSEDYVLGHKDRVAELTEQYELYQEKLEEIAHTRSRRALEQREKELRGEVEGLQSQIDHWQRLADAYDETSRIGQQARDRVLVLGTQLRDNQAALEDNRESLDALGQSHEQVGSKMDQLDEVGAKLSDRHERLSHAQRLVDQGMRGAVPVAENLREEINRLELQFSDLQGELDDTASHFVGFIAQMEQAVAEARQAAHDKYREENRSLLEERLHTEREIARVRSEIESMEGRPAIEGSHGDYQKLEAQLRELEATLVELGYSFEEAGLSAEEAWDRLMASRRSDEQNIALARDELRQLNTELVIMRQLADMDSPLFDPEAFEEGIRRALDLQNQLRDSQGDTRRSSRSTVNELQRELDGMERNFQQLRGQFDATGVAYDHLKERQGELDTLLQHGRITVDEHTRAWELLTEQYEEAVDPLREIREQMDPVSDLQAQYVKRVRRVSRALDAGTISQQEATRALELYHDELEDGLQTHDQYRARTQELLDEFGDHSEIDEVRDAIADMNERLANSDIPQHIRRDLREARQAAHEELEQLVFESDAQAQEFARAWEEASKRIDETFADAFAGAFDSFEDFADNLLDSFKRLLAELAYQATLRPIVVGFTQDMGGMMGIPGMGGQGGGGFGNTISAGRDLMQGGLGSISWTGASNQAYSGGWAGSATGGMGQSGLWGGSTANFSGGTGLASSGAGFAGNWAGGQVFGDSEHGDTLGTIGALAGTYFGGPLGAAIGSFIGQGLGSAFSHSPTQFKGEFATGEFDPQYHFAGDSAFGQVGFTRSGSDRIHRADGQLDDKDLHERARWAEELVSATIEMDNFVASLAGSEDELDRMTQAVEQMSSSSRDASDLIHHALVERPLAALEAAGHEISDIWRNLSVEELGPRLQGAVSAMNMLSQSAERLDFTFDDTHISALMAADSMVQMAGGFEGLMAVQQRYYEVVHSDTERLSHQQRDLFDTLSSLVDVVPSSVDALSEMVRAQDLNTESGRRLALQLMELAPALDQTYEAVRSTLEDAYQEHLGREADSQELAYWMERVASGVLTLEEALWNIENSAESAARALYEHLGGLYDELSTAVEQERQRLSAERDATVAIHRAQEAALRDQLSVQRELYGALQGAERERYEAARQALREQTEAENALHQQRAEALQGLAETAGAAVTAGEAAVSSLRTALQGYMSQTEDQQRQERGRAMQSLRGMLGGDIDQGRLEAALGVLGQESGGLYRTFDEFDRQRGREAALIGQLESQASTQLSVDEQQLATLERQIEDAEDRHDRMVERQRRREDAMDVQHASRMEALESQRDAALDQLRSSIAHHQGAIEQARAHHEAEMARLDDTLDYWERQIAVATGTQQATKDVGSAVNRLAESLSYGVPTIPAFASGGMHRGGARLVGERGPEVEVTGPSRIYSHAQSQQLFDIGPLVREIGQLRRQVAKLEAYGYEQTKVAKRNYKIQDRWDRFGVPQEVSS